MASSYLELRSLVASPKSRAGITIAAVHPPAAAAAATRHQLQEPSTAVDQQLLIASSVDDQGAFLCLRCRVSFPLEQKLLGMHRQFGRAHDLDLITMAGFVLDDDGRPLSYPSLRSQPTARITPFTAQVVCSYNPDCGAGLPHWARIKFLSHNPLKAYLREQGLLLISPWALLADTSSRRIREALKFFGVGSLTSERAVALHSAYCSHYVDAKDLHQQRTGRSSGWVPSDGFLQQLDPDHPPDTTREQLLSIDQAVRTLLTQHWQQKLQQLDASEAAFDVPDPTTLHEVVDDEETPTEQLALIHAALERAIAAELPAVIAPAAADSTLRCLWQGFGEGLTNTPLAERCGCARGTVSKKLRPEQLAGAIARRAAAELLRYPVFAAAGTSVEGLERMVEALRNHLLTPEREGDVAPLRRAVAQLLADSC